MDELEPLWVRAESDDGSAGNSNPYADLVEGKKPPEIIEFDINMSPYGKMPPNMSSVYSAPRSRPRTERRPTILVLAVSVTLLIPVVFVFVRELALHFGP